MSFDEKFPVPTHGGDWTKEDWNKYWNKAPDIAFQLNEYNPELVKREKMLFPSAGEKYKILFPLCGKSYDMRWAADKGHDVIGVDCSEKAVTDFFKEHNITFEESKDGKFKVFKSTTAGCDVTLYVGDIYDLPEASFEKCDAVFDYGSFIAIKPDDRKKYIDAIQKKLANEVNYLLCVFNFDGYILPRAPAYQTSPEMVTAVFGEIFNIDAILGINRERFLKGFEKPTSKENYYHLTRK